MIAKWRTTRRTFPSFLGYSGGKGLDVLAPNNTSTGIELKRKEDARALIDHLNELVGR